jgi:hypothetical protein
VGLAFADGAEATQKGLHPCTPIRGQPAFRSRDYPLATMIGLAGKPLLAL